MLESFEFEVNRVLRAALEKSGALALETLEPWNRLNNMVTSGSKGSKLNISQIIKIYKQYKINILGFPLTPESDTAHTFMYQNNDYIKLNKTLLEVNFIEANCDTKGIR
jgi:DNA-directed RNA polymerase II subunit RPB1